MIINTVNNILGKNDFDTERIKVIFNSAKVTDHHAIIPTVSSLEEDMSTIPESERKIYKLILNKLHESAQRMLLYMKVRVMYLNLRQTVRLLQMKVLQNILNSTVQRKMKMLYYRI